MIYSIALIFDEETNKQIYQLYTKFKNNLNLDFGLTEHSIPHTTIIKFESQSELPKKKLDNLLKEVVADLEVDFSGITFLPSHFSGCWIEISILKNQQLVKIQNNLTKKLHDHKIKSEIEHRFRPHITLAKINDCKINLKDWDYSILRKKQVTAKIAIGSADSNFEFYEL